MSLIVDFLSIASVIGIWPRYIEPKMLRCSELKWRLAPTQAHLDKLTIVHLSDLHFHKKISKKFLNKVVQRIALLHPDLILFTGDFICYSQVEEAERLKEFLNKLEARLGCYGILGNHDYSHYVSRNPEGIYDLLPPPNPLQGVLSGLATLLSPPPSPLSGRVSDRRHPPLDHPPCCPLLPSERDPLHSP